MGNEASSEAHEPAATTHHQGLPHAQHPRAGVHTRRAIATQLLSGVAAWLAGTIPTCIRWPHGGKTAYICGSFTHWQKMPMQWRQTVRGGEWFKVSFAFFSALTLNPTSFGCSQVVDLVAGSHQYKFIVDGQWRHDHTAPTVLDNLGNVNNCINVVALAEPVNSPGKGTGATQAGGAPSDKLRGETEDKLTKRRGRAQPLPDEMGSDPNMRAVSDPYYLGSSGGLDDSSYGQVVPAREELMMHHAASLLLPPQMRLLLPHHHGDSTTMPLMVQMHHAFCHLNPEFRIFAVAHRFRDKSVTQLLYKPTKPVIRTSSASLDFPSPSATSDNLGTTSLDNLVRRTSELRQQSKDVRLQSVRISSTRRSREDSTGQEYTSYLIDSVLSVHGVQTTLRSERRYKHFNLLDELLRREFPSLVPQALPAKRPFGNLHPGFVEERRVGLEKYIQQCVAIPQLASSSVFCKFIEADPSGAAFDLQHSLKRVFTKQGYLLKRGRKVCSWKRRYFCIYGGVLYYYYTAEIANPFQALEAITLQSMEPYKTAFPVDGSEAQEHVTTDFSPSVMVQPDPSTCSLKGKHVFAIHTSQRTWHLAADSKNERAEWIRVLCEAGSQLSASSEQLEEPTRKSSTGGAAGGRSRETDSHWEAPNDEAVVRLDGVLWKRASKVHVNQVTTEKGSARGWVQRHFRLLRAEGLIVYLQNAGDSVFAARGIVQLSNFVRVEDSYPSDDTADGAQLHAFQLVPADTTSDHAASEPLVLAASTASEKAEWMERLATTLVAEAGLPADATRRSVNAEALETQLAAASIS